METTPKYVPHTSPKGMWISKASVRALSLIFVIALLGLVGSFASKYESCGYYCTLKRSLDDVSEITKRYYYYYGMSGFVPVAAAGPSVS